MGLNDNFKKYVDKAKFIFVILNNNGTIEYFNDEACKVFEYSKEEVIGKNWFDTFFPITDSEKLKYNWEQRLKSAQELFSNYTNNLITKYDKKRVIEWNNSYERDENGFVTKILGVGRDITNSSHGLEGNIKILFSLNERIKELNFFYSFSKLMGERNVSIEYILKKIIEIVPNSMQYPDVTCVKINYKDIEFESENFSDYYDCIASEIFVDDEKSGSLLVGYIDEKPSEDEGPFTTEELFLIKSITELLGKIIERYLYENDLVKELKRKTLAIETSKTGVWDRIFKNEDIYFSKEWKEMLGYKEDEISESFEEWEKRIHPDDKEKAIRALNAHIDGKTKKYRLEHRLKCKDGTYKWISALGKITERDPVGKPIRMIGTHTDITDLKELQLQTEKTNKLLEMLAEVNSNILKIKDIKELLQKICEIITKYGKYNIAFIGFIYKDQEIIDPVAYSGVKRGVLESYPLFKSENGYNKSSIGNALHDKEIKVYRGKDTDKFPEFWKDFTENQGVKSSISIPLLYSDNHEMFGALNIYSDNPYSFNQKEREFLNEIGHLIVFSIESFEKRIKIEESEKRFNTFMDYLPIGTFIKDDKARNIYLNKYMKDNFFGETMLGKSVREIYNTDYAKSITRDDFNVLKKGYIEKTETFKDKNDIERDFNVYKFPFSTNKKSFIGGIMEDITERKIMEQQMINSLERTEKNFESFLKSLGKIIEIRDPYTAGHQIRVAELAVALAQKMNLPEDKIKAINIAGLLHDIGKIYVPTEILNKSSKLTELEFKMIKEHSQIGYDFVKGIEFDHPISEYILQHHEKLNGSGYPKGLKDKEIFIESKILTVADVVEAINSHRPYRPALGLETAFEEIVNNADILYDSQVVKACLEVFNEGFDFTFKSNV